MDYPNIDSYASIDSPIHRFDPRAKILTFTFLIFSLVFVQEIVVSMVALIFSFLVLMTSKLPLRFVFKRVWVVMIFVLPLLIIMTFTVQGTEIFSILGISATYEGLRYGSLVVLRALAAVILVLTMLGSMRFDVTIKALYVLKVPSPMVQMIMFAYRYIFVIIDEFVSMWRAMSAKGFRTKTSRHALLILGNLVGMLIVKSYERSERVYQAMISKGYAGNPKTKANFAMRGKDYVLSMLLIGFAIMIHLNAAMM